MTENLDSIGTALELGADGIWYARGHTDLGFLNHEDIDWALIESRSFWYRHRNLVFASILHRFPASGTFFEIGAGNGYVSLALQELGLDVVAIEPTVRSARIAKKRGISQVACTTIEEAGFPDGIMRNAGMFDVIEHIEGDADFLGKLRRLISRDGRLYCAVPAYNWLWSSEDTAAGHKRRYTAGSLAKLLDASGFRVEFVTYYFAPLLLPIWLLRALPTRLGRRTERTPELSRKEHEMAQGGLSTLLQYALNIEMALVERGITIPLGASCIAVAKAT